MPGMTIHLPYSIGDKVYYASPADKTMEVIIRGIHIYQNCILYGVYNKEEDVYFVSESDNIYLTREETKEAIKGGK